MKNTKLTHAISLAITGVALAAGGISTASAGLTIYYTYTTTLSSNTDGWVRWDGNPDSGPPTAGNSGAITPWVGTSGSSPSTVLPFNYIGSQHMNWAVDLTGSRDSAEISTADAVKRYAYTAEIDTGGGAWFDNGKDANGNITEIPTGWKHQTDIGVIRTGSSANITLKLSALGTLQDPTFARFGITIFTGMNTATADYSHHGAWNRCGDLACVTPPNYALDNPFYPAGVGSGLTFLMFNDNVNSVNGLTFHANPGQLYSVFLGGWGFSNWNSGVDQYKLEISSVPEPDTLWLFGSALAGMGLTRRRKAGVAIPT